MNLSRLSFISCLALIILAPVAHAVAGPAGDATGPATQADVILLVVYVLLALVMSFLCSVAEAVLLSITPSYIAGLRETSPKRADLIQRLKEDNVDQSLAAILTLNTIAHTVGAIGSGAKATIVFGSAWFGVFSAVMTLMILFLSEIIPKTLGAVYWRSLAGITAQFVRGLVFILYPLIVISELLTRFIARGKKIHAFSRDEFVALAGIGEQAGHLDESESRVIRNLLRFGKLAAEDIMTPRTVIHALPEDITVEESLGKITKWPFSRVPVYKENIDGFTGFVLKDEVLMAAAKGRENILLSELRRELPTTIAMANLSDLLERMLDARQHIAIVVGEYGGTLGLVTLEDVVETLLGTEIVDEIDRVDDMQAYARQRWERRAKSLGINLDKPTQPEAPRRPQDGE